MLENYSSCSRVLGEFYAKLCCHLLKLSEIFAKLLLAELRESSILALR